MRTAEVRGGFGMLGDEMRFGIGKRLAMLFVALLVIGLVMIQIAEQAIGRHGDIVVFTSDAGRLRLLTSAIALNAHQYPRARQIVRQDTQAQFAEFEQGLDRLREQTDYLGHDAEQTLARLTQAWQTYRRHVERLLTFAVGDEAMDGQIETIDVAAEQLLAVTELAMKRIIEVHEGARRLLRFKLYGVLLLGLSISLLTYWRIRDRVVKPIQSIRSMAHRIAEGDLTARAVDYGRDELGELVEELNRTATSTEQLFTRHREMLREVADSELRNRTLWETSSDGILMMDRDNIIRHINPAAATIFGYAVEELLGQHIVILQPERMRSAHATGFARYLASGQHTINWHTVASCALHKCGHEIPVELSFTHIKQSDMEWFVAFFRDITLRTAAEAAVRLRDRAMDSTGEGIMITDALAPDYPTIYINPSLTRITGYAAEEVLGRNARFLVAEAMDGPELSALRHHLRERKDGTVVFRCLRKDGSIFWNELSVSPVRDDNGRVTHTISIFKDVSDRRRQEEELFRSAHLDSLTGLANRTLFHDRIEQAIAVAHRHGRRVGLLFIDLDNFKLINDSLGHEVGDELLRETGSRIETCLREGDTAARLGGDEFVILLTDLEREEDIALVAERVLQSVGDAFHSGDKEFFVGASIGASLFPRDGEDGATLLKNADIAMYRAKDQGRNNFQAFTSEMQERIDRRMQLESHLRKALDRNEFELHYQPQVSLETGCVIGAEALIRWRHPELGLVSPVQFVPLAEETGLIVPIGEWVLDTACAEARLWRDTSAAPICVGVNLSALQFRQNNLTQLVSQSLRVNELRSLDLELELTESMVMEDPEETTRILGELKSLGLRISLDDFGTGYSSLSHLRRFPIDVLKVDQSFIREVTINADDACIASSIIALAHGLQLKVIAEGVETREQLQFLVRNQCDMIQGFYFSRPLPAAEFRALIVSGRKLDLADLAASPA